MLVGVSENESLPRVKVTAEKEFVKVEKLGLVLKRRGRL